MITVSQLGLSLRFLLFSCAGRFTRGMLRKPIDLNRNGQWNPFFSKSIGCQLKRPANINSFIQDNSISKAWLFYHILGCWPSCKRFISGIASDLGRSTRYAGVLLGTCLIMRTTDSVAHELWLRCAPGSRNNKLIRKNRINIACGGAGKRPHERFNDFIALIANTAVVVGAYPSKNWISTT